jgi:hypothetical protein
MQKCIIFSLFQYFKGHLCGGAAVLGERLEVCFGYRLLAIGYRQGAYALNFVFMLSPEGGVVQLIINC